MLLRRRWGAGAASGSSIPKSKSSSFGARFATFGGWSPDVEEVPTAGTPIWLEAGGPLRFRGSCRGGCRFGRGTTAAIARIPGEVPNGASVSVEPGFGSVTSETLGAELALLWVAVGSSGAGRHALGEG